MSGLQDPPAGWHTDTTHRNSEGELFGLATSDAPEHEGKTLLIVWDDPFPQGTGTAAIALLDDSVMTWLNNATPKPHEDTQPKGQT